MRKLAHISGIADHKYKEIDFDVYPNPCRGKIQITRPVPSEAEGYKIKKNSKLQTSNSKLEIFDITGRVVLSRELPDLEKHTIDVDNLPKGIYLCKISLGNKSRTKKIIKE